MKPINYAATGLTLAVALTALLACSTNTALVGRDTLPPRAASRTAQSEVVGTVERVNTGSSEIFLRPSPGQPGMVSYSAETRVMYLGRVYPVSQLRLGDVVAMQMEKDAGGNPHTHVIRLEKSTGVWAQRNH